LFIVFINDDYERKKSLAASPPLFYAFAYVTYIIYIYYNM